MNFIEVKDTDEIKHLININHIEEIKENQYNKKQTVIQIPYKQIIVNEEYKYLKMKLESV
jgi:hypothetical protein